MQLITYPNNILTETMPDFDFDNPVMPPDQLEEEMVKLMINSNGLGLSANQVGIRARVFTIFPQNLNGVTTPFALFNPKVVVTSPDNEVSGEGCLSFPQVYMMVERPINVVAEFLDRNANKCIIRFDNIDARCFMHELDHLDGVCFTERVSALKKERALKKLRKLQNG